MVDEISRTALQATNRQALVSTQRSSDWSITERDLPAVQAPTLVIWGSQDAFLPVEHADRFGDGISEAEMHTIDGCGHNVHADCPDRVVRLIGEFLR
jgi:pimeloyl-ACP methyl ester carboxylesterase